LERIPLLTHALEVVEAVRALKLTPSDGAVPWKLGCSPAELPSVLSDLAVALEEFDRFKRRAQDPFAAIVRAVEYAEANGVDRHGMVMAMRGDPGMDPDPDFDPDAEERLGAKLDPAPGDIGPPDPTAEFTALDSPKTRGTARKRTMVPGAAVGQSVRLAADAENLDMQAASDLEDVVELGDAMEAGDVRVESLISRLPSAIAGLVPKLKGDGMKNADIDYTIQDAGDMSYHVDGRLDALSDRLSFVQSRVGLTPAIRRMMQALRKAKHMLVAGGGASEVFALQIKQIDEALERIEQDFDIEPQPAGMRF
jgi:hypothetical protein